MDQRVKAKQSLGQNFLVDENMARKIVQAINPQPEDVVVEIGPGHGSITRFLVPHVQQLYAVEIDQRFYDELEHNFSHHTNFELIRRDILAFDLHDLELNERVRVLGNIPYNITSPILFRMFDQRKSITDVTLLLQKEVGLRMVARPHTKEYGILAVFSQAFADVKLLLNVPPTVFQPRPKVDSTLVQWRFTNERDRLIKDEQVFRSIVKKAFGLRRKMLRNSLKEFAQHTSFDFTRRPEQLSVEEWIRLSNELTSVAHEMGINT